MIVLMKGLNEENMVDYVVGHIHDEEWVDRIIVIDGGSTDLTVWKLKQYSKVEVYVHPWDHGYHDMEVSQSNIALSYVPHGSICFILDFDERVSDDLKNVLRNINENGMPEDVDCASVSRMSYELFRYDDSPFAMADENGSDFFMVSHQIGSYPDFQMRIIRRKLGMHWINSPHHILFGVDQGLFSHALIKADLIHYHGKEDARQRDRIEIQWARSQARRKELGLMADVFDGTPSKEFVKFIDPEMWK